MKELIKFIVEAKKKTYAISMGKVESSRKQSTDLSFKEGDYEYLDSYFGGNKFSGQEIVYHKGEPVWSMNYYGEVLDESMRKDIISFLKESLMLIDKNIPYRGAKFYESGSMTYVCESNGDIQKFMGEEKILHNQLVVYHLDFHGGSIK